MTRRLLPTRPPPADPTPPPQPTIPPSRQNLLETLTGSTSQSQAAAIIQELLTGPLDEVITSEAIERSECHFQRDPDERGNVAALPFTRCRKRSC